MEGKLNDVFRSAGDVKFPLFVSIITMWLDQKRLFRINNKKTRANRVFFYS